MLKMARELARHGHGLPMIEALLKANGFHEADVFLNQPHIHNELVEVADRARRGDKGFSSGSVRPNPRRSSARAVTGTRLSRLGQRDHLPFLLVVMRP